MARLSPRFKRTLYQIHLWLGVALATPLLMAALTGSLLLFRYDIIGLMVPGGQRAADTVPAEQMAKAVQRLDEIYGTALQSVRLPDDRIGVIDVRLKDDRGAYFDPVTLEVVREWDRNTAPFDLMFELHHRLFAGEVGEIILGVIAICASVLLLVGVWVWFIQPRPFKPTIWPKSGSRIGLLASHRDLGILIALPLLIGTLSASVLEFPNGSRKVLDDVLPGRSEDFKPPLAGDGKVDWQAALNEAAARFPDSPPRIIAWPAAPHRPALIRVRQPAEWHPNGRTAIYIDPATSKVIAVRDALTDSLGARVANTAYPLHSGLVGKPRIRWLSLFVALTTVLISIYGFIAWLGRYRKAPV